MFCIITPVFNDAHRAVSGLINDLKEQTFEKFKHVLISNGPSLLIKAIVDDDRFIYVEYPEEPTPTLHLLVENISRRKNYVFDNFHAERYFFFDADLLVQNRTFLQWTANNHDKADVIISRVSTMYGELPQFPIQKGNIDIANYSVSRKMVEKYRYPTDCDLSNGIANDWRFYSQMKDESHWFNDMCYARKDGRHSYKNLSTKFGEWKRHERSG